MKKTKVRTPTGKVRIKNIREKTASARCANCKKFLHGMPKVSLGEMKKLAKSDKRPGRPYGGYLCSDCTREIFRDKARSL